MKMVSPFSKWSYISDYTGGLTWDRRNSNTGTMRAGTGEMCFDVRVVLAGFYYFTAFTSAPHRREHNDMWVRLSAGFRLLDAHTNVQKKIWRNSTSYFKAYQNFGSNMKARIISTVDRDPHILVSEWMKARQSYKLCISGRSTQFSVYTLVLVKCSRFNCQRTSDYLRSEIHNLDKPRCVQVD